MRLVIKCRPGFVVRVSNSSIIIIIIINRQGTTISYKRFISAYISTFFLTKFCDPLMCFDRKIKMSVLLRYCCCVGIRRADVLLSKEI